MNKIDTTKKTDRTKLMVLSSDIYAKLIRI